MRWQLIVPDVTGGVNVGIGQPGILSQGENHAVITVLHRLRRQVTFRYLGFRGSCFPTLLLFSPCLYPRGWQPAVRQSPEHSISSTRRCGMKSPCLPSDMDGLARAINMARRREQIAQSTAPASHCSTNDEAAMFACWYKSNSSSR